MMNARMFHSTDLDEVREGLSEPERRR